MRWCCTWDPDGLYWQVCAYEVAEKHDVFSTQYRFCPVVCYRSSIVAGEPWGYGPGLGCLPDVKVGNRIVQLELQSAAIAVSGVWQAEDDGVLNPRSVKLTPGAIIPIAQGSKGLQPLQFPGRIDISQAKLDEIQNNVKRAFYVVKVKPEDAARMTATGYAGQKDQMIREMRGMYGQLRSEFAEPVMLRTLEIAERMGLVKEPLMERLTDVLLVGPLAQDVQGAEVQRVGQGHHGDRAGGRAGRRHGGGQAVRAGAVGGREDARREQGVPVQARAGEAGDAGGDDRQPDARRAVGQVQPAAPRGAADRRGDRAGAADAREGRVIAPIVITVDLPAWLVAILERLEPPQLAVSGPLTLLPRGQPLETSVSSIPNDKDGVQHFVPAAYDGPLSGAVVAGDAVSEVRAETPDGLAQRLVTVPGATGSVTVRYRADLRHGEDVVESVLERTYEVVPPDEPGLQTTGVDVVDKLP
jgi:hypothetical protein